METKIVKGTVWKHARRTTWAGEPETYTVTCVKVVKGIVYSKSPYGVKIKTPIAAWEKFCAEVVSVPTIETEKSPRFTPTQAARIHAEAHAAGMAAGEAAIPTPMVVVQREHPFEPESRIVKQWEPVMEGVCGFAYVTIKPGTSSYAKWIKAKAGGFSAYYGGVQFSVHAFGQSLTRKEAYAGAYAAVAREHGIKAYVESRMD